MVKTMRIAFALRSTYRVNSILHAFRHIPLVGKYLPEALYAKQWVKILAQVLALMSEVALAFLGKLLYLGLMVTVPALLYPSEEHGAIFLHIFLILSLAGGENNGLCSADETSYYAVDLLNMDARSYMLVQFGYSMIKLVVGYLIFGLLFGLLLGANVWACLLMPFFAVGFKTAVSAWRIRGFIRTGTVEKMALPDWIGVSALAVLLGVAYGLPAFGIFLPVWASTGIMLLVAAVGAFCVRGLLAFRDYRVLHRQLWYQQSRLAAEVESVPQEESRRVLALGKGITSSRRGFEYLNELFFKRHRKLLWGQSVKIAAVAAVLAVLLCGVVSADGELAGELNGNVMSVLPAFAFVMYGINRGTSVTQAMFVNCDHSLLTYSFYKNPKFVLRLFGIRLRELVKVNLLPGTVIAVGLPAVLYASGGTEDPLNYGILFVSVISMSIFFSTHYLTLYYLMQPYTAGSDMTGLGYKIATALTYVACYALMEVQVPPVIFGMLTILFCAVYCVAACVLVYFLAPKTFRIRD